MRKVEWDFRGKTVGMLTTNVEKFRRIVELSDEIGVDTKFELISPPGGVDELVSTDGKKVIIKKLTDQSRALEQTNAWGERKASGQLPDYVLSMDVLAVAANLPELSEKEAVMKKPESGETALQAFVGFFALCDRVMSEHNEKVLDAIKENKPKPEDLIETLVLKYYMLQAIAPVKKGRGVVDDENTRAEWDKVEFTFSHELVRFLANPGNITRLADKTELADMLSSETIRGFKIQALIPLIIQIAAERRSDDLWAEIAYSGHGKEWEGHPFRVDGKCDLKTSIQVGRKGIDKLTALPVGKFLMYAVKNITPRLLNKMFDRPKAKKEKNICKVAKR